MRERKPPYIAIPLNDDKFDERLNEAFFRGADIIELRVDMLKDREINHINKLLREVKNKDMLTILTVRAKWEGGETEISDEERVEIINNCLKFSDFVDIELSSHDLLEEVKDNIKLADKKLIVSYHDFEKTPSEEVIRGIIEKSLKVGADVVKYAFNVNHYDDVGRIMSITYEYYKKGKSLIAIGMGDLGKITRVAGYFFGSIITYSYIGSSVAPGQIEISKLKDELNFYNIRP